MNDKDNTVKNIHPLASDIQERTSRHPCFTCGAGHQYARMHLPVAPACNISCNYCNRLFDCLHESRPGVTSEILTPEAALAKYMRVKKRMENLSVAGIAGPGDALANWESTRRTIELIKEYDPEVIFCLSTNGLMLPEYASEIVKLGVRHVTVTVNCLHSAIGEKIYQHVHYQGKRYQGAYGASILIQNQTAGIKELTSQGVLVKVNIVMIQGINDSHVPVIVKNVKDLGVSLTNIMPLIPAGGSTFENYAQTSMKDIKIMRDICAVVLPQMSHCRQCRADAIGLLGDDRSLDFRDPEVTKETRPEVPGKPGREQYHIAVATRDGRLVDRHFGHTSEFAIYRGDGEVFQLVEKRKVVRYCNGKEDCDEEDRHNTVNALQDCHVVLSLRIGYHARERLLKKGVLSFELYDTVENGLKYAAEKLGKAGKKSG